MPVRSSKKGSPLKFVENNKHVANYVLLGILVVAAFVIGSLYQKVKYLEGGGSTPAGQENVAGTIAPTQVPEQVEIKIDKTDPTKGDSKAKVKVVTFEDFQCPYCGAFTGLDKTMVDKMKQNYPDWEPALPSIIKDYVDSGKVLLVWKDYPFLGEESKWAAEAARCAQDQGKFWDYHDYLFSHQSGENQGAFSKDNLKKFAQDVSLNAPQFNNCLDNGKYTDQVANALTYGQSVGVNGTPATFIDGKQISGADTFATFKTAIDAALK